MEGDEWGTENVEFFSLEAIILETRKINIELYYKFEFDELNGTICRCLCLPEVPEMAFGTRRIWPSVSRLTAHMSRYLIACGEFIVFLIISSQK